RYVVNVAMRNGDPARLDPEAACPAFLKPRPDPFKPRPGEQIPEQRTVVLGPKMRSLASAEDGTPPSGLLTTATTAAPPARGRRWAPARRAVLGGRGPGDAGSCAARCWAYLLSPSLPPPSSSLAIISPTGMPWRSRPSARAGWPCPSRARRSPA